MALLIVDEKSNLVINPESLLIKEFKALYTRDTSDGKEQLLQELSYIYWMYSVASEYYIIKDIKQRDKYVKELLDISNNWTPDAKVKSAIKRFETIQEEDDILSLFKVLRSNLNKLKTFVENMDYNAELSSGALKFDPSKILDIVKRLKPIAIELKQTESDILRGISREDEFVGSAEKSIFEDEIDI